MALAPKIMACVRRRPGMTHGEYVDYVVNVHGELAKADPRGLHRYVQNHVFDGAFGVEGQKAHVGVFHRDSVTELYFADFAAMAENFSSEYVRTVIAPDGANFAELATNESLLTHETAVLEVSPVPNAVKIMHFLFPAGSIGAAQSAWQSAHDRALAAAPDFAQLLCGVVRSDAVQSDGGGMGAHFGGGDAPSPALVISLWIPKGALAVFRKYEAQVIADSAIDQHNSYFLYTQEVEIFSSR